MTLIELQRILGERVALHNDMAMDSVEREKECDTSEMIARLAKQMINNADVVLRSEKMIREKGYSDTTIEKFISPDGFKPISTKKEVIGIEKNGKA